MAINLLRHDPKKWTNAIEECYKEDPELKKFKQTKNLIEIVKTCEPLLSLGIDDTVNEAVRKNNKAVVEKAEANPTCGGNIACY